MQSWLMVFAYFGPEIQLPVISFVGAVSGLVMIVGATPIRIVKRWLEARSRKPTSP
jgi:hypothetical protein